MLARLLLLFLLFAVLCSACSPEVPKMTPEENHYIDHLTAHMTTRCIGRYLIDLPEAFGLNSQTDTEIEGVKIKVTPMNEIKFENLLSQRETELRKMHMDGEPNNPVLKKILELPDKAIGKIFNRAEDSGSLDVARTLELWHWGNGYLIRADINAIDASEPKYSSDAYWKTRGNDTPQKLAHLLKVYERVQGRAEGEIPTGPGLCIAHGFVAGKPEAGEQIDLAYDLKGAPDVFFSFLHTTAVYEDTTLLQRSGQVESEMAQSGSKTIRKGDRTIDNHPYEEWLMKGPTPYQVPGTLFTLNGNETAHDPSKPFITWELYNGFRIPQPPNLTLDQEEKRGLFKDLKKATLSEAEAVALWDKVTTTLRPRPGAF